MHVFVTGASGHIGSAVVAELLSAGHQVTGLARSDASAAALESAGATVRRGDLGDLDVLAASAAASDGVIHLAFRHDLMFQDHDPAAAAAVDLAATKALGTALEGSGKPLVTTGGTMMLVHGGVTGRPGTEQDALAGGFRIDSENATVAFADRGVRSAVVRLSPIVHSHLDKHGFVPMLIGFARQKGAAGYVEDGANRWPAVDTRDAARLYRLAVERVPAGSRLHGVQEGGIPFRSIAEAIGERLGLPAVSVPAAEAEEFFGPLAGFVGTDNPVSNEWTRQTLGWEPEQPGLLDDLRAGHYFA